MWQCCFYCWCWCLCYWSDMLLLWIVLWVVLLYCCHRVLLLCHCCCYVLCGDCGLSYVSVTVWCCCVVVVADTSPGLTCTWLWCSRIVVLIGSHSEWRHSDAFVPTKGHRAHQGPHSCHCTSGFGLTRTSGEQA